MTTTAALDSVLQNKMVLDSFVRQSLFDGAMVWNLKAPLNGRMSPELKTLLGLDNDTIWQDVVLPADHLIYQTALDTHIRENDGPFEQVARFRHRDGHVLWLLCKGAAIRDDAGNPTHMVISHVDLTSFMRSAESKERAWRRTYERLNAVLNTAHSGIIGIGADGRVMTANPPARAILGDVRAQPPFRWPDGIVFLAADSLEPLPPELNPITRILNGAEIGAETHLLTRPGDGSQYRFVRLASAQVTEGDTGLRAVIVIDDITEQEQNRQSLERSSRLDALGQLTGGIAHDFNNLLTTLLYSITLSQKQPQTEKANNLLETAKASVYRGRDLTRRLLAFGKRQPGLAAALALQDVVSELEVLVKPVIEAQVALSFEAEQDCAVLCDPSQLENALVNLVLNSRDAIVQSGRGGLVTVQAKALSDEACRQVRRALADDQSAMAEQFVAFEVTDDGPGMPDLVRQRATDPFFTTKSERSGTGLGLSMVYGFARQSQGLFQLESREGHGTTARLILPRADAAPAAKQPAAPETELVPSGQTILLAEDESAIRSVLAETLRGLGYRVIQCANGQDACDIAKSGMEFDILLTDVVMPGAVNGFGLARMVRELAPERPVIFMSGYTNHSRIDLDGPEPVMLQKPFEPELLTKALNRHKPG